MKQNEKCQSRTFFVKKVKNILNSLLAPRVEMRPHTLGETKSSSFAFCSVVHLSTVPCEYACSAMTLNEKTLLELRTCALKLLCFKKQASLF